MSASSIQRRNSASRSPSVPRRRSRNEAEDDARSVTSNEDDVQEGLTRPELMRLRRFMMPENNLVEAFETAAATDLSHHLFGFALEKTRRVDPNMRQQSRAWTSKSRREDDDDDGVETLRRSQAWAAWPCVTSELPQNNAGPSAWSEIAWSEPKRKKIKTQHHASVLRDALTTEAMRIARENMPEDSESEVADEAQSKSEAVISPPMQSKFSRQHMSPNEDQSVKILTPMVSRAVKDLDLVFANTSPIAQVQKSRPELVDWQNILANASSLGWDSRAVGRARKRCSLMFGSANLPEETGNHSTVAPSRTRAATGLSKDIRLAKAVPPPNRGEEVEYEM